MTPAAEHPPGPTASRELGTELVPWLLSRESPPGWPPSAVGGGNLGNIRGFSWKEYFPPSPSNAAASCPLAVAVMNTDAAAVRQAQRGSSSLNPVRQRLLISHTDRQAGELGREEPDEVQPGQGQGPAPGGEQPQAPVQAGAELLESSSAERDWECWGTTG